MAQRTTNTVQANGDVIAEVKARLDAGESLRSVAKVLGVDRATVAPIVAGLASDATYALVRQNIRRDREAS